MREAIATLALVWGLALVVRRVKCVLGTVRYRNQAYFRVLRCELSMQFRCIRQPLRADSYVATRSDLLHVEAIAASWFVVPMCLLSTVLRWEVQQQPAGPMSFGCRKFSRAPLAGSL
jgi:hypothetical protein